MFKIPYIFILAAVLPAFVIAVLYYFDHSVSAQLAQQEEFNLRKPTAYHYDLLLVGGMVKFLNKNHIQIIMIESLSGKNVKNKLIWNKVQSSVGWGISFVKLLNCDRIFSYVDTDQMQLRPLS